MENIQDPPLDRSSSFTRSYTRDLRTDISHYIANLYINNIENFFTKIKLLIIPFIFVKWKTSKILLSIDPLPPHSQEATRGISEERTRAPISITRRCIDTESIYMN